MERTPYLLVVPRVFVDVELDDLDLAGQFSRKLIEHGCDRAAWPAPLRPEIHEDGLFGVKDFLAEIGVGNVSSHGFVAFWVKAAVCLRLKSR